MQDAQRKASKGEQIVSDAHDIDGKDLKVIQGQFIFRGANYYAILYYIHIRTFNWM